MVRFIFRLVLPVLLFAAHSHAITIDTFNGSQSADSDEQSFSGVQTLAAIGNAWKVNAVETSNMPGRVQGRIFEGYYSQSQDAEVSGHTILAWDGTTANVLSGSGLGGINFLQDGGTSIVLELKSYNPPSPGTTVVEVSVFDASNPDVLNATFSIDLLSTSLSNVILTLPFSGFVVPGGGLFNFANVGAIRLRITGGPAADLTLSWAGTNGICELVPDEQGKVIDECGVCGGDNSSCSDCAGVPNGTSVFDECNVCGGDNSTCSDCAGVPNGNAQVDRCGVCNGDGNSCLGCKDTDNSGIQEALDSGAKKQERLLRAVYKRIDNATKNKAILAQTKVLRKKAHELQIRNWILSWSTPNISKVCENQQLCSATSNLPILDEYRKHSEELRAMMDEAVKLLAKVQRGSAKLVASFTARMNTLHKENMELADLIPVGEWSC